MTAPVQNPVLAPINRLSQSIGAPNYIGSIVVSTTSATNGTTANPFGHTGDCLRHKILYVVPSTATMRFHPVALSTDTVSSTRSTPAFGFPMPNVSNGYQLTMNSNGYIAVVDSTTTGFLDVWEMLP